MKRPAEKRAAHAEGAWYSTCCMKPALSLHRTDTQILETMHHWYDFAEQRSSHTVVGTLKVLDGVYSPQLHNRRRLYVYLPPSYAAGEQRYAEYGGKESRFHPWISETRAAEGVSGAMHTQAAHYGTGWDDAPSLELR